MQESLAGVIHIHFGSSGKKTVSSMTITDFEIKRKQLNPNNLTYMWFNKKERRLD